MRGRQTPRRSKLSAAKRLEENGRQTLKKSNLSLIKRVAKREAETEEVQSQFSQEGSEEGVRNGEGRRTQKQIC